MFLSFFPRIYGCYPSVLSSGLRFRSGLVVTSIQNTHTHTTRQYSNHCSRCAIRSVQKGSAATRCTASALADLAPSASTTRGDDPPLSCCPTPTPPASENTFLSKGLTRLEFFSSFPHRCRDIHHDRLGQSSVVCFFLLSLFLLLSRLVGRWLACLEIISR